MLKKIKINQIFLYISSFILIELLSYFSLFIPWLNDGLFIFILIVTLGLAIYKLEYAFLIILAELFIGSMGHLFMLNINGFSLSIRIGLWLAVMLIFLIKFFNDLFKNKKTSPYLMAFKNFKPLKYFLILGGFVLIGLGNAYLRGNELNLIFSDFNAWLYYLLLFPGIIIYSSADKKALRNLKEVFLAAVIWLSLKTFLLLYVFTHSLSFSPEVYTWLRRTLVGEMTATLSGWPRIFIQGQIFSAIGLFLVFWKNITTREKKITQSLVYLLLAAIFTGVLLISFSRSFWLALLVTILFLLLVVWRIYSWKKVLATVTWLLAVFALSFTLLYFTTVFPYPKSGNFNADFISRVDIGNNEEAAISSRWSLLPVLMNKIMTEPLFGQGYGATVTYISNDPRVLENNSSGNYTTFAFEWGYLDIWLKIGFFALLTYLLLIIKLIKESLVEAQRNEDYVLFAIAGSLIFLAVTNFFTPYLNHPLGIGVIVVSACLIKKNRVY